MFGGHYFGSNYFGQGPLHQGQVTPIAEIDGLFLEGVRADVPEFSGVRGRSARLRSTDETNTVRARTGSVTNVSGR